MPVSSVDTISVIVPAGVLGGGVSVELMSAGLKAGAVAVAVDAGSTDSGPSCLATGVSKVSRDAVKRDLKSILTVAIPAGLPILVGSCGTSGTDMGVDWTFEILKEVAQELAMNPRVALLYCEQDTTRLVQDLVDNRIQPLAPAGPLRVEEISDCDHIVALMGPEPYIWALEQGAQIILGGRTTDTAVLAAIPLMRGMDPAHSWHGAKVAECGGLCTVNPRGGGVLLTLGQDFFEVRPLAEDNFCTPETVSAHMLYENSDPFTLTEPGGVLDVSESVYRQQDDKTVRVTGSRWNVKPYTMKLEGASSGPFQTIMLIGIQDPKVLADIPLFLERMHKRLADIVETTFPGLDGWNISLRPYGWNAVSDRPPPQWYTPLEIGLLMVVTASSQELATRIAKALNSTYFHFPLQPNIPLPTYAFPFSPAEIERGQVYEFRLNHVVETDDPMDRVRFAFHDL